MLTVLLWFVAVAIPCAVVLRLSGLQAEHQRATAPSGPRRRERRAERRRSRRRPKASAAPAPAPVRRPPPRLPRPTAEPLPTHRMRSTASLVMIVGLVGVLVAVTLGGSLAALALALRAAVD